MKRRLAAEDQVVLLERLQRHEKFLRLFRVEIAMQVLGAGLIDNTDVH